MAAPGGRGRRRRSALATLAFTTVAAVGAWFSTTSPLAAAPRSSDDAVRGLVHGGLVPGDAQGPCRGNFELIVRDVAPRLRHTLCTHGPDPAPDGVDVRQRRQPAPAALAGTSQEGSLTGSSIPCYGNGVDGYRVHVLYVRASDVPDRFAAYAASFVQWTAAMNDVFAASAAETGGTRNVRLVTDASCNLVVDRVLVSPSGDDNFSNMVSELQAKGYNRFDRKYLVYADANVYCGIAQVYYDDSASTAPGANASNGHPQVPGEIARVDNGCWGRAASVEAHELMHNLGGVQTSAPNATSYNHCRDDYDRMCYADGSGASIVYPCPTAQENRFDCKHDDYFSTSPPAGSYLATHWNTANSAFLSTAVPTTSPPPTVTTTSTTSTSTSTTTTTTVAPTGQRPSAPRNLTATSTRGSGVRLSWQPPTTGPVTSYRVYRGRTVGLQTLIATLGNVTSYTDATATRGLTFYYYVTAANAAGEGPGSRVVAVVSR